MKPNGKWVVITGASTGIGRACAMHLHDLGYQIIAGVRKQSDEDSLRAAGLWPMHIDVTDASTIAEATVEIKKLADNGLCGLVNNAGIGVVGPIEYVAPEDWRRQFEVNVIGQIAMTQAMLPLLRLHVQALGKGAARIIMIGSIAGKISQPIMGPYCASKFAIEALSDCLRLELARQGIHTSLLEPGAIQSEIWRKGQESADEIPRDHPARELYNKEIDAVTKMAADAGKNAIPASAVAKAVADALSRRVPRTRYVIGRDAKMGSLLKRFLPDRLWDRTLLKVMGMKVD